MPVSAWLALLPLLWLPAPCAAAARASPEATWLVFQHGWWVPAARRLGASNTAPCDDAQVPPPASLATRWRGAPSGPAAPDALVERALDTGLWLGDGLPQGADVEVLDAGGWILLLFEAQRFCAWLEGAQPQWHAVYAGEGRIWRRTP